MIERNILKSIVKLKVKYQYAYGWCSSLGMSIVIADVIQRRLLSIDVILPFWLIFLCGAGFLVTFGIILIKFKMLDMESSFRTEQNTKLNKLIKGEE